MLPERLSTDLTSLNDGQDRLAIVVEMTVGADGSIAGSDVYPAAVHNRAKLAYDAVAAWLDGKAPAPDAVRRVAGMEEQLRVQDAAARKLRDAAVRAGRARSRDAAAEGDLRRRDGRRPCGRKCTTAPGS